MDSGPLPMKRINVAIAGLGGVGKAVAGLLLSRRERYRGLYNVDVRLVAACGSRSGVLEPDGLEIDRLDQLTEGLSGVGFIQSSMPDVLIEAGPSDFRTGAPGHAYIGAALDAGVHAIVISKGALVFDGLGLLDRAAKSGALLKVSGATAAALPTIDLLTYNLKGCEIFRLDGILNATTNFLLSVMMNDGLSFDEALSRAQAGGFAERDPRNDTEGWDTASKLLILANFGLGARLSMADLAVDGIQNIAAGQIADWRAGGLVPKLVGTITRTDGVIRASVGIQTFPLSDVFAHVMGKTKAIRIQTDVMGEIVAIGGGPEPLATAAATLKDFELILDTIS